jgi:hypothetical protein
LAKYTEPLASDSDSKEITISHSSEASACEAKQGWPLNVVSYEKGISLENGISAEICAYDRGTKLAFLLPFSSYNIPSVHLSYTGRHTVILSWFNENMNLIDPVHGNLSLLITRYMF